MSQKGNKIKFIRNHDNAIFAEIELDDNEINGGTIDGTDTRDPIYTIFTVERKEKEE